MKTITTKDIWLNAIVMSFGYWTGVVVFGHLGLAAFMTTGTIGLAAVLTLQSK